MPVGGYLQQTAIREGNTEYIKLHTGMKAATRKWDEATGIYKFTKLGKQYYKTQRRNYLVSVPVLIQGRRKDGSTYQLKSRMPIEKLGLKPKSIPLDMDSPTRYDRVRGMVEAELPDGALYEVSDETWTLDPTGNWRISEETVKVEGGVGSVHIVLDRRLGAQPVYNQFLFPDALCDEAFEDHDDKMCCPRQIAAILKLDLTDVCNDLLMVERALYQTEEWEQQGYSPRVVLEYCRMNDLGCVIVHNEAVIETLAFPVHEGHSYFYKTPRVRLALMRRRTGETKKLKKAQRAATTPLTSEWKPWASVIEDGHFFVPEDELSTVRA